MSIASEITRLQNAKTTLKTKLNSRNDNQHQITNELIDEYGDFVDSIPSGGGRDWSAIGYSEVPISIQNGYDYAIEIMNNWDNTIIDLNYKFNEDKKLVWFPLVDTSKVTNMSSMFNNCTLLKEIPQLNTSNVTNMSNMFTSCTSLEEIPQFDTSNVTKMSNMFYNCTSLKEVPQLNTSKVTSMNYMFNNCTSLEEIPQFDTSNVTNMSGMFVYCTSLKEVPQLNTSKVTSIDRMFYSCNKLTDTSIDNILQFCITSKIKNGTLQYLGFKSNVYPTSRIEALPHYQDFLDAGWTIGY